MKKTLNLIRDLPYMVYLAVVFPSRRWRSYYRHALNEYSATSAWPEAQAQHMELLKHLPPSCSHVLDLGCGDGWSVNYIKQILGKDVVGFTCNPQELRFARRHYPRIRIKFGDMHSLSFRNEEFDAVYCREAYEHSVAPYIAMCEMNRVLRYHGYLLINIPDEQWLAYDSHFSVLTQAQMSEMFRKCRFELLQKGRSPAGHYWYLARKTGQAPGL
jgi:ubiquinone/menaquinone biosynthesis C-methylase UbiE